MRNHEYRRPALPESIQPLQALLLKNLVTDGKNLIDDKDVGLDGGGNSKSQAEHHAGGVRAQRRIDKVAHVSKLHNLPKQVPDLRPRMSEKSSVEEYIFPPCQFRVKPRPKLQKRCDAPLNQDSST